MPARIVLTYSYSCVIISRMRILVRGQMAVQLLPKIRFLKSSRSEARKSFSPSASIVGLPPLYPYASACPPWRVAIPSLGFSLHSTLACPPCPDEGRKRSRSATRSDSKRVRVPPAPTNVEGSLLRGDYLSNRLSLCLRGHSWFWFLSSLATRHLPRHFNRNRGGLTGFQGLYAQTLQGKCRGSHRKQRTGTAFNLNKSEAPNQNSLSKNPISSREQFLNLFWYISGIRVKQATQFRIVLATHTRFRAPRVTDHESRAEHTSSVRPACEIRRGGLQVTSHESRPANFRSRIADFGPSLTRYHSPLTPFLIATSVD